MNKVIGTAGDVAAIAGIVLCVLSGAARLAGQYAFGGVRTVALFSVGIGILPFAGVQEAYLRLGAAYWSAETTQSLLRRFDGTFFWRWFDENDTGSLFGLGVGASPAPHWHFRLEIQTYSTNDDLLLSDGDASTDTLPLEAQFRPGAGR